MIYKTLNRYEFVREFDVMNRSENFTPTAREALFDFYEELSDGTGDPFVLDVIAVCCDWTEYTAEELAEDHGTPGAPIEDVLAELAGDQDVITVEHWRKPDTYLIQC